MCQGRLASPRLFPAAALPAQDKEPGGGYGHAFFRQLRCRHRTRSLAADMATRPWQRPMLAAFRGVAASRGHLPVLCFERSSKEIARAQLEGNCTSAARRKSHKPAAAPQAQDKEPGGRQGRPDHCNGLCWPHFMNAHDAICRPTFLFSKIFSLVNASNAPAACNSEYCPPSSPNLSVMFVDVTPATVTELSPLVYVSFSASHLLSSPSANQSVTLPVAVCSTVSFP